MLNSFSNSILIFKNYLFSDKTYHSKEEESKRMGIYSDNLDHINKHNSAGIHTFQLAMNHLGDLLAEEFKEMLNGFVPSEKVT